MSRVEERDDWLNVRQLIAAVSNVFQTIYHAHIM